MRDFIEREFSGLLVIGILAILYFAGKAILTFLNLFTLTLLMVLLTAVIAVVVIWEEWVRPKRPPVAVEAVDSESLRADEDFAFNVENVTGTRISGGSRVVVMPRNLKQSQNPVRHFSFNQPAVLAYLRGNDQALENELKASSAMYCFAPAYQTGEWRGPWATYLPVAGGDKRKKISTKPFQVYRNTAIQTKQRAIQDRIESRSDLTNKSPEEIIQEETQKVEQRINRMGQKLKSQVEEQYDIQIETPKTVLDCMFPTKQLDNSSKLTIELRNIAKYYFKNVDGEWECYDHEKIKSD